MKRLALLVGLFLVLLTSSAHAYFLLYGSNVGTLNTNLPLLNGTNTFSGTQTIPSMVITSVQMTSGYALGNVLAVYGSGNLYTTPLASLMPATNAFTNNYAKFNVIVSPSPAVVANTLWTNTYGSRVQLTVDGTYTLAVTGASTVTYTNTTTTESHDIAGSTQNLALGVGVQKWSMQVYLSTNDVIKINLTTTLLASAAITKSTVTLVQ